MNGVGCSINTRIDQQTEVSATKQGAWDWENPKLP